MDLLRQFLRKGITQGQGSQTQERGIFEGIGLSQSAGIIRSGRRPACIDAGEFGRIGDQFARCPVHIGPALVRR